MANLEFYLCKGQGVVNPAFIKETALVKRAIRGADLDCNGTVHSYVESNKARDTHLFCFSCLLFKKERTSRLQIKTPQH